MYDNMSYMWDEFNIKTFPAETIVYRDGVFCKDLSTISDTDIKNKYDKPVHIIYVGEISNTCKLNINILAENQPVFLSINIKNKKPAFLNIFIKNAGKKSDFRGHILLENFDTLNFNCTAEHNSPDTVILVKTKLLAHKDSISKLSGTAIINKSSENVESDISFSALADKSAKISFLPAQRISAVPHTADHSASIYQPSAPQIEYLREAGLSSAEVRDTLSEAFIKDFSLF